MSALCECSTPLDALGLCPVCDAPDLNPEVFPDTEGELRFDELGEQFWQDQDRDTQHAMP